MSINCKRLTGVKAFVAAWIAVNCLTASAFQQEGHSSVPGDPSLGSLLQTKAVLEQQIVKVRSEGTTEQDQTLRTLQAQLLEVTGKEDELLQRAPQDPKALNAVITYVAVPVFYVTDRSKNSSGTFGADQRAQGVEYGSSMVTLGLTYGVRFDAIAGAHGLAQGTKESAPTVASFSSSHDLLKALEANQTDRQGRRRRAVLFVHGYSQTFSEAVRAAARLSTEVQFPVIPVAFTWPSSGTYAGYWHDEEMIRASSSRFRSFLLELLTKSPIEVVIVCHSMGAREVASSLAELGRSGIKLPALRKVIFAASDISAQEFANEWPDIKKLEGVQVAFYASNHDLALRLSHIVHDVPRLGDASPRILAPVGGMTIDASSVDPVFQALGHSYILDSPKIGADVGMWVDGDASPATRNLMPVSRFGQDYLVFP